MEKLLNFYSAYILIYTKLKLSAHIEIHGPL